MDGPNDSTDDEIISDFKDSSRTESESASDAAKLMANTGQIPTDYYLAQSYPNPFNAATTIEYGLPTDDHVSIDIYDITGRKVKNLVDEDQQAGSRRVTWNATGIASGTYLYVIQTGKFRETKKMQYLK